jgi:hypothetical protein
LIGNRHNTKKERGGGKKKKERRKIRRKKEEEKKAIHVLQKQELHCLQLNIVNMRTKSAAWQKPQQCP